MMLITAAAVMIAIVLALGLGPFGGGGEGDAPFTPPDPQASSDADDPPPIPIVPSGAPNPTTTTAPPSDADTEAADPEAPPEEDPESGPVLVPLAGTWSFADGDGTMDCDTLSVPLVPTPPALGQMEVLDGGTRIRVTSSEAERGIIEATLQPGATGESAEYEGALDPASLGDIPAGGEVTLIFTATFDSSTHAETEIGGTIESAGTTCTIERTGGEANRIGD